MKLVTFKIHIGSGSDSGCTDASTRVAERLEQEQPIFAGKIYGQKKKQPAGKRPRVLYGVCLQQEAGFIDIFP